MTPDPAATMKEIEMPDNRDYGKIPGNQEPNTPDYDESKHRRHEHPAHGGHHEGEKHGEWSAEEIKGTDPSEYKNIPGNQTANTPDVDESRS